MAQVRTPAVLGDRQVRSKCSGTAAVTAVLMRSLHRPSFCLPGLRRLSGGTPGSGLFSASLRKMCTDTWESHVELSRGWGPSGFFIPSSLCLSPPASFPMTSYIVLLRSPRWMGRRMSEADPEMNMHIECLFGRGFQEIPESGGGCEGGESEAATKEGVNQHVAP